MPCSSRQMVIASSGLSAWLFTSRGPTTRSEKIDAFVAVWVSVSKTSRASSDGKSGSVRNPPSSGLRRPMVGSPVSGSTRPVSYVVNRLIGPNRET